ncbi:aminotransferase class I/II-fold pyridoxal phosphate-dependent enzyme [Slackia piriformis]|uniref:aminotransferase class I/II-fold pyridoxal phosphate-dependent enzyme n=1 Tax=Slackia piriformis TaxID=626934 RepID=UPI0026DAAD92|nr:aminotransferase class I/II-fold pyridoxal phosphate-dependent enzyme [Slackia piriformis]MDO5023755.1 aminotransferase class I/II-fold pyridoxal phosphate-dependent enzyme [Slackia piriformis]
MPNGSFSDRLKQSMESAGIKQADLIRLAENQGKKLGKSQVSQYVSGKTIPRKDVLDVLALVLGVDRDWLLGGVGERETAGRSQGVVAQGQETHVCTNAVSDALSAESDLRKRPSDAIPSSSPSSHGIHLQEAASRTIDQRSTVMGMREFKKSSKLDNVLYDVRGPVADEAARMEGNGQHILKLNIGNPAPFGFRTPFEVVQDMRQQLPECEGYSDSRGLFSARKAIMQYAQIKHIPNVGMDDIYTGNGVSELINLSMQALLDSGDEVLIPSPDYPLWTACVTLSGGTPVHYICDEEAEWYPDIADIESKVTPRTKAIVIINPNNPTGAVYPREVLQEIVEVARKHQLIIFSDEIYDRLCMDGVEHVSIAELAPDLPCVTFSGLSKSHMIAGYRIGWMIFSGEKKCIEDFMLGVNMLSNMRLCSNVPAQSIVQTALGGHQSVKDYVVPGGRVYEQRNFVYEALCNMEGVSVVKPKAAFYIFPKLDVKKFGITDDEQFALDLLHQKKILITRGGGFNWHKPDHFRIVYLPRIEVLSQAMGELGDFLEHYHQ